MKTGSKKPRSGGSFSWQLCVLDIAHFFKCILRDWSGVSVGGDVTSVSKKGVLVVVRCHGNHYPLFVTVLRMCHSPACNKSLRHFGDAVPGYIQHQPNMEGGLGESFITE